MPTRRGNKETTSAVRNTISLIRGSDQYRNLTPNARAFMDDQLFGCRTVDRSTPMSALHARIHHAQCLHHTVQLAFNDLLGNYPLPVFGTFSFLDGEVPMGTPLQNSQTTIFAVTQALQNHGLEGILMPDIDLLLLPGSEDPILACHLHGVLTPVRKRCRLKRVAEEMAEEIGKPSRLAKSVELAGKRPGHPLIHAENIATYGAKYVSAIKDASVEGKAQRGREKFQPIHALFGLHAWSQLPLLGAVIPVGQFGEIIQADWLARVRQGRDPLVRDVRFTRRALKEGWMDVLRQIDQQ